MYFKKQRKDLHKRTHRHTPLILSWKVVQRGINSKSLRADEAFVHGKAWVVFAPVKDTV